MKNTRTTTNRDLNCLARIRETASRCMMGRLRLKKEMANTGTPYEKKEKDANM
jgi:hypothetical protein